MHACNCLHKILPCDRVIVHTALVQCRMNKNETKIYLFLILHTGVKIYQLCILLNK